ncbi:MAG: YdeI/OmpD-associated family protein [Candidatus Saccharibacteria bacterium]|nr:YdeI/OmpD-associated family protein [Candidatus Saccharibacteria bacterium]
MQTQKLSQGSVHSVPNDLREALLKDDSAIERWDDITPLARNEWICWVITNKRPETRSNHIQRTVTELLAGKRRPCCWSGCPHRKSTK